jgi:hypothetical protein
MELEGYCRGGFHVLASSRRHPQTSPPPATRPQHIGPSCQEQTRLMQTSRRQARPPHPLSLDDASNEGMAPERHRRLSQSFGFSPEIGRSGRNRIQPRCRLLEGEQRQERRRRRGRHRSAKGFPQSRAQFQPHPPAAGKLWGREGETSTARRSSIRSDRRSTGATSTPCPRLPPPHRLCGQRSNLQHRRPPPAARSAPPPPSRAAA